MNIELRGNTYCVRYWFKGKHIRLTDKSWTKDVGKRQIRQIIEDAVAEDKRKREEEEALIARGEQSMRKLSEDFLDQLSLTMKTQTAYSKRHRFYKHIVPCFDMDILPCKAINFDTVQQFRIKAASKGKPSSINHLLCLFREFMEYLAERDYLTFEETAKYSKVCAAVSSSVYSDERVKDNYWTTEEWDKFIATFDAGDVWRLYFEVSYWCALRIGEATALRFGDFDFDKNTLTVMRSKDKAGNVTCPKTNASRATIQVRSEVADRVKAFMESNGKTADDEVFPMSRTTIARVLARHATLAKVKQISPHGLRHSIASRMINSGVNILTVSRQLRHSSPDETLKTYSHLFPNTDRGIMEQL